jgi:RimJ/RimL family protein N-acetyltransferase
MITLETMNTCDGIALHQLRTHPEVVQYINRAIDTTVADMEDFITVINADPHKRLYKIIISSDATFIGTIALKHIDHNTKYSKVGYELLPDHQRKGSCSQHYLK